jgi:hypothetical protein
MQKPLKVLPEDADTGAVTWPDPRRPDYDELYAAEVLERVEEIAQTGGTAGKWCSERDTYELLEQQHPQLAAEVEFCTDAGTGRWQAWIPSMLPPLPVQPVKVDRPRQRR